MMKRKNLLILLSLISLGVSLRAQDLAAIFEQNRPLVCKVTYYKNMATQSKIGSFIKIKQYRIGVVVSPEGLVMVSSDVYPLSLDIMSGTGASYFSGEPSDFQVTLWDGREYPAEFIGKDDLARVAFIQISQKLEQPLPFARFVPTDHVQVGQPVYLLELLGQAYQFEPIFTPVTVNAIINTPRKKFLVNNYAPALSAGGLVLDALGRPIGVTLENLFDLGFQSPMEFEEFHREYLEIAPSEWFTELIAKPPVLVKSVYRGRAWLGIRMQALTPELRDYWQVPAEGGVVVDEVFPDSPAEKGGLQPGDVLIALNGTPLEIQRDEELNRFREKIAQQDPGAQITLTLFRDGQKLEKKIQLQPAPRAVDLADKFELQQLGIEVRELTRDVLYDYMLPLDTRGVYVYRVDRASPAGMAGLEIGSIITEVDGHPVNHLKDFRRYVEEALREGRHKIMFRVQQRRHSAFVFLDVK